MSIIKNIKISNFKAIGDDNPIAIEFAPITLLFGPNSAGKSSVVQALQYAYEVLVRRNFDADKTLIGGESVELGGFLNMVHQHDKNRSISISFELDLSETDLPEYFTQYHTSSSEIENRLSDWDNANSAEIVFNVAWSDDLERPYVEQYFSLLNGQIVGEIRCFADSKRVDLHIPGHAPLALYEGTDDEEIADRTDVMFGLVHTAFISDDGNVLELGIRDTDDALPKWGRVLAIDSDVWADSAGDAADIREFTEQLSRFIVGPGELLAEELEKLLYLGPLRDVPERNLQITRSPSPGRWASGLAAWDTLLNGSESLISNLNQWLDGDTRFNTGYQVRRESFREVPIDAPLNVALDAYERGEADVFDFGDLKAWLDDLPIRHRVELVDTRSGIALLPQDLGIGISQMLPILVAAFVKEEGLVMIEQPELHIHPALQVEMGDLFIERSVTTGCKYLIETHSEHLLLRLLRRIRETSESGPPPGMPDFHTSQLAIYFIEPGEYDGAAEARRLNVSDEGDFADEWPRGFFEERAKELF